VDLYSEYGGPALSSTFKVEPPETTGGRHPRALDPAESWRALGIGRRVLDARRPFLDAIKTLMKLHYQVGGGGVSGAGAGCCLACGRLDCAHARAAS
jgi:hypothetical protein